MTITYQRETMDEVLNDIQQRLPEHLEELAVYKEFDADPDLDKYRILENQQMIVCMTARANNVLVGYMVDIIYPHMHYKTMIVASNDFHYIVPEYRAKCARGLTKAIEKFEKACGVYVRTTRVTPKNKAHRFDEAVGYHYIDATLGKIL